MLVSAGLQASPPLPLFSFFLWTSWRPKALCSPIIALSCMSLIVEPIGWHRTSSGSSESEGLGRVREGFLEEMMPELRFKRRWQAGGGRVAGPRGGFGALHEDWTEWTMGGSCGGGEAGSEWSRRRSKRQFASSWQTYRQLRRLDFILRMMRSQGRILSRNVCRVGQGWY